MIRDAIRRAGLAAAAASIALLATAPAALASAETADEFVARINKEFADIALEVNAAGWTQATYINVDTQLLNARAFERYLEVFSRAVMRDTSNPSASSFSDGMRDAFGSTPFTMASCRTV